MRWVDRLARGVSAPGRRPEVVLCAVLFAIYVLSPAANVGDSRMSLPTAVSLYHDVDLTLDEFPQVQALADNYDVVERDGRLYMGYPWAPALLLVPLAATVDLLPGVDPGQWSISEPNRTWVLELPLAALLTAIAVALFRRALLVELGDELSPSPSPGAQRALLVVVTTFALGTVMWSSVSRGLSQHAAAAPFVVLAMLQLVRSRRDARVVPRLGLSVAAAYVMRPTAAVLVVAVTVWVVVCHRRYLWSYLAWAAVVAVPWIVVNIAVFGTIQAPYYSSDKIGSLADIPKHAAGLLLSPSRGVLWFTPLMLLVPLGVRRLVKSGRWDSVDWVFAASAAGVFLVVAAWPNWWGGSSFGPRLLSEAIPFACWYLFPAIHPAPLSRPATGVAVTARRRVDARLGRLLVVTLAAGGVLMNSQGAALRATLCWNTDPTLVDADEGRLWDWDDPQALRGARRLIEGRGLRDVVIGSCGDSFKNPNSIANGSEP